MKSIIKDIFYGNRGNPETIKISEEYCNTLSKLAELYDAIHNELPKETKGKFEDFCKLQEDLEVETVDAHFIEGVKIGILLGIEACDD